MFINVINLLFVLSIAQADNSPVSSIKNMTVTQGLYSDRIIVEWDKTESVSYSVLRSQFKTGEFIVIAETSDLKFEDTEIERGVKYWYKVIPSPEISSGKEILITAEEYSITPEPELLESTVKITDSESEMVKGTADVKNGADVLPFESRFTYSGYTSIEDPVKITLPDLMKLKNGKLKVPAGAAGKKKQKKILDYLKNHYMNSVKLSLFMTVAKPYIERGELMILTDCDMYEIKKELNQIVFYGKNYSYMVVFESKKILKIISGSDEAELEEILIKNSDMFCLPKGKSFIVDKAGITRLVNAYDAVGISTGYVKHDSEWRYRTVMTATSRSDLKDKLKNASSSNSN
jgi:hypothetical protein